MESPVIALMTDFGEDDFFVASLKGVILNINPSARIVDITHRVPSFNLEAASFVLFASFSYFPPQTIFLVVVDPGVGSARKILLAKTKNYYFISPDNGVLTLALEEEKVEQLRRVTNDKYFLPDQSRTFEGRDRMAPTAAWLSRGISCEEFGPELTSYKKLRAEKPQIRGSEIFGRVLYEDKFGNLITNIPVDLLGRLQDKTGKGRFVLSVKGHEISSFVQSYSSVKKGELLFLAGSAGTVEIAAGQESAAVKLKVKVGDEVRIKVKDR
ncbi:MAG: S-adenosyl-l-methionine hydroxide adenosyltransferase family protein [Candidatus Aminicenantes bacterium]|nr:S-adenosyl-l-methionine hydroxide adenosyltransferase family protein [Candidatus Aminicenantes bacterium]MDH5705792.1 S-adenosyl-l-methionine hydroxide adenosyltransferase family protein [Candidatus Aminicenantes bacterium]